MGYGTVIAARAFSQRVLERVQVAERKRHRRHRFRHLVPLTAIVVIGGAWAIALFDGVIALRMSIEVVALVVAIGNLEQHLGSALLGPFAPIPLLISLLLFIA